MIWNCLFRLTCPLLSILLIGCASSKEAVSDPPSASAHVSDNLVTATNQEPADNMLPLVGEAHRTDTSFELIELELPQELVRDNWRKLRWTFFLCPGRRPANGDRYMLWLNDELIYHNDIEGTRWMPEVRHFESPPLRDGQYRIAALNTTTGERLEHEFNAEDTKHIVIFDRRTQPMTIRTFHYRVPYR